MNAKMDSKHESARREAKTLRRCSETFAPLPEGAGSYVCCKSGALLSAERAKLTDAASLTYNEISARGPLHRLGLVIPPEGKRLARLPVGDAYCPALFPETRTFRKPVLICLGVFAGSILLSSALPALLLLSVPAILLAGLFGFLHYQYFVCRAQSIPSAAPLNPKRITISSHDRVQADIAITTVAREPGSPGYLHVRDARGSLNVSAQLSKRELQDLEEYEKVSGRPPDRCDWHLGFLSLRSTPEADLPHLELKAGATIPLVQPAEPGRPLLANISRSAPVEIVNIPYQMGDPDLCYDLAGSKPVPAAMRGGRLFPFILGCRMPDFSGRALTLDLFILPYADKVSVEVELDIPDELVVDDVTEQTKRSEDRHAALRAGRYDPVNHRVIWEWSDPGIDGKDNDMSLRFKDRILDNLPAETELRGRYRVHLEGYSLSRFNLGHGSLYLPNGQVREQGAAEAEERVTVEGSFTISRAVLNHSWEHPSTAHAELPIIPPDHHTIRRVTAALRECDVYLAKVYDNPPILAPANPSQRQRNWDLLARKYAGGTAMFGVDIHIVLSGIEDWSGQYLQGRSSVEITTRALVHDARSKQLIDALCSEIHEALSASFASFRHPHTDPQEPPLLPMADAPARPPAPAPTPVSALPEDPAETLRRLQEDFLDGRVTEDEFVRRSRELKSNFANPNQP